MIENTINLSDNSLRLGRRRGGERRGEAQNLSWHYEDLSVSPEVKDIRVQTAEGLDPDLQPGELAKNLGGNVSVPTRVPLLRLYVDSHTYRTQIPIEVHIYKEGEWFFAENETLVLVGSGKSFEEAMYDLQQHIIYFWRRYNQSSENNLMGDAIRLKNIYSNLLIEE